VGQYRVCCVAITLSKWDLMEQKRKEEEAAAARKQPSYDDIDGRSVYSCYLTQASCLSTQSCDSVIGLLLFPAGS